MDIVDIIIAGFVGYGIAGLVAVAFVERFIPVIPSSAMLVTIGAAAADGHWLAWEAVLATAVGGSLGWILSFLMVQRFGVARSTPLLLALGASPQRIEGWLEAAAKNRMGIALLLQLLPTARILAPLIAVVPGKRRRDVHMASFVGIATWNAVFIGAGYVTASAAQTSNVTGVVLGLMLCATTLHAAIVYAKRRIRTAVIS